jgi:ubiquinone/menaquinone biosynthesis C-methylase UbiE
MLGRFAFAENVIAWSKVNSWLDLGCGCGDFFRHVLENRGQHIQEIVGVDITRDYLEISSAKVEKFNLKKEFINNNIIEVNLNRKFDLITFSGILQMFDIKQVPVLMDKICSYLKPGGQLWFDTLNYEYSKRRNWFKLWTFKIDELIKLFEHYGFQNIRADTFHTNQGKNISKAGFILSCHGILSPSDRKSDKSLFSTAREEPAIGKMIKDLSSIALHDQDVFLSAAIAGCQTSWLYYFPFLYCFSLGKTQTLLWEKIDNSVCIYFLRQRQQQYRLHLFLPPFPFNSDALKKCRQRVNRFNGDQACRIFWIEESQKAQIEAAGFHLQSRAPEFVFDTSRVINAHGQKFESLRKHLNKLKRIPDIHMRDYRPEDQIACKDLLRRWREVLLNQKGIEVTGYGYTKSCLENAFSFKGKILKGEVVVIGEKICGFTFGGPLSATHGSIFVAVSDHEIPGLGYLQRHSLISNNQHLCFFNDSSDTGRDGLSHVKERFRPVRMNSLYRAREPVEQA